jgi:hypothetical protein
MDTKLVDLKAKNLEGNSVFDILKSEKLNQGRDMQQMRDRLRQGNCFSCLIARVKLPVRAPGCVVRAREKLYIGIRRRVTDMTDDRRNALLVVATLLLTVTYQAALSAPAEAQKANHFNSTAPINASRDDPFVQLLNNTAPLGAYRDAIIAATTAIKKNVLNGNLFLLLNTLTYFLTNVTLLFLVPPDSIGSVLYLLLVILSLCYFTSTPLSNIPQSFRICGLVGVLILDILAYVFTAGISMNMS